MLQGGKRCCIMPSVLLVLRRENVAIHALTPLLLLESYLEHHSQETLRKEMVVEENPFMEKSLKMKISS